MAGKGKEILWTVSLPHCEDDEEVVGIADVPPIPSHSEAFKALSTTLRWLEAQDECNPIFL